MKKVLNLFTLLFTLSLLVGCEKEETHEHTFSNEWNFNSEKHWHNATCEHSDIKTDEGYHVDTNKDDFCDVCNALLVEEKIHASKEFNNYVNLLKTSHNYKVDVCSEVEGFTEDENYYDAITSYNGLALEFVDYEYFLDGVGYIAQKDQGFVKYYRNGENIIPDGFVSTNSEIIIPDFYEVIVENLFLGEYVQDEEDVLKFTTDDVNAIAVAANMTGFAQYISAGMLHADNKVVATLDLEKKEITITFNYWLMYFDIEWHDDPALLTLTIKEIGEVKNEFFDNYLENPSHAFAAPTQWNDFDKEVFEEKFNNISPIFPEGLSYAYSCDLDYYDGFEYACVIDKASGDLRESYGIQLMNDGYTKTGENTYKKITFGIEKFEKDTYFVVMLYTEPSVKYPKGVMNILYRHRNDVGSFEDINEFNYFLTYKEYDKYVPLLPYEETCTGITNVKDTTSSNKDIYLLKINGTDTFHVNIPSYSKAKAFASAYANLLIEKGYSSKSSFLSGTNYSLFDSKAGSYVFIDIGKTESEYSGYVGIRYTVYKADEEIFGSIN